MKTVPVQQEPPEPAAAVSPTWGGRLRRLLYRNTVAALVATAVDFLAYSALVATGHVSPPAATGLGCVLGAIVNFTINRVWTFESRDDTGPQLVRYALVSGSGAGLNAGGVALLLWLTPWDYRVIWWVIRLAVSWGWNAAITGGPPVSARTRSSASHRAC